MKLNLISCDSPRPDKRAISKCLVEIADGVNDALSRELTDILLEGDAVEIEINNNHSATYLRKLRKLAIDYDILD